MLWTKFGLKKSLLGRVPCALRSALLKIACFSLLAILLQSCSDKTIEQVLSSGFDGLTSAVENPDGSYSLSWSAPLQSSGVAYTLYQKTLDDPESFSAGITFSPALSQDQMPASAGTFLASPSENSYLLKKNSIVEGQAVAFSVVAKMNGLNKGDGVAIVIKKARKPTFSIAAGNYQSLYPKAESKELVVKLMSDQTPVPRQRIDFEVVQGSVTLASTTSSTGDSGEAATTVTAGSDPGIAIVRGTWGDQKVEFTLFIVGSPPAEISTTKKLVVLSGDKQKTNPNVAFALPLKVQAVTGNTPVADALVTFSVASGPSGAFSSPVSSTNTSGIASTSFSPSSTGNGTVRAKWEDSEVLFSLSANNDSLDIVSGNNQSAEPGTAFPDSLRVRLLRNGLPLANEFVTLEQISGARVSVLPSVAQTDAFGDANFGLLAGSELGDSTWRVKWEHLSALVNLSVANLTSLRTVSGNNQVTNQGTIFSLPLRVEALRRGLPAVGERVSFAVEAGPTGTFSSATVTTDSNGIAQTSFTSAAGPAGQTTVRATWGSSSSLFTLNVVNEQILILSGDGQSAPTETSFSQPLRLKVLRDGTVVSGEAVNFSVRSVGTLATLSTPITTSASDGVVSTAVQAGSTSGALIVRASWGTQSVDFNLNITKAKTLVIVSGNGQSTLPGTPFSAPLRVQALEAGQPLTDAVVSFAVASGPGGDFALSSTKTDTLGIASTNYTPASTGSLVVNASWGGQTVQFNLNVSNDSLDIVTGNNQSAEPGTAFPNQIQVKLARNGIALQNESLLLAQVSGVNVTFVPSVAVTDANGIASFNVFAGNSVGTAALRVTWGQLQANATLTVASLSALNVVAGNNQVTAPGTSFTLPLQVQAMRRSVPVSGENVSFSVQSGPTGTFSQTVAALDAFGIAQTTFTPVAGSNGTTTVKAAWGNYEALFSLSVVNDQLVMLSGDGQSADPLNAFAQPLRVKLLRNGLPLAGEVVQFAQLAGSVSATFSGTEVSTSNNGEASVSLVAGSTLGTVRVRASWGAKSVDFALSVTLDEKLNIVGGNLQSSAPLQVFSEPLKVRVEKDGAPVAGASVSFSAVSGAGVTFATPIATSDATGIAQTAITATSSAGSSVVRASWRNQTADFTLTTVSQSGSLQMLSGNGQSGEAGSALGAPLVVQVLPESAGGITSNILVRFYVVSGNGKIETNQNMVELLTNSSGIASVGFTLGSLSGSNVVRALIVGKPSETVNFSLTGFVSPNAAPDLSVSNIIASPQTLVADGIALTTVTLTLRDQAGNQIPRTSGAVTFSASSGTLVGSVQNNGDGTWSQQLQAPTSRGSGTISVSATYDGTALQSAPASISLISGNINLAQSTISLSPSSIEANGSSSSVVTVTLRDDHGNQVLSANETVVITVTSGSLLGTGVTNNNNGTYQRSVRSNTVAQNVTVSATVGGVPLPNTATLAFTAGAPDVTKSTLQVSPSTLPPNGIATSTVTLVLRDANSNQVNRGGDSVVFNATAGSWSSGVIDSGNGSYQRVLRAGTTNQTALISATVNGSSLPTMGRVYITSGEGGPSPLNSTVEIIESSKTVPADGSTELTVRVTLKDSSGTQMTSGGSNVVITSTGGSVQGSVLDNGNGTYTQKLRAPLTSQIATVGASFDGQTINSNATARFYGGISLAQSTLAVFPPSAPADGSSTSLIVLTAKDASGIAIPTGGETGIAFATTQGTLLGSLSDNGNGTYSQSLRAPNAAAVATVTASKGGVAFSAGSTVTFFAINNLAGVTIDCANISTYQNTNLVVSSGTLTMNSFGSASGGIDCASQFVFGAVVLSNSATITHSATTASQEFRLEFISTGLSIDATSKIDVSGKGFPGQPTYDFQRTQGNIIQSTFLSYGSIFQPNDLGASGRGWNASHSGGQGGGRLKISISGNGALINHGLIAAKGAPNPDYHQAGFGGSIWISTGSISGSGSISADGGVSTIPRAYGNSSGRGGRVAVYYTTASNNFAPPQSVANITACGGSHVTAGWEGAAGTVYLKSASQTFGDLIVNNCGRSSILQMDRTVISGPASTAPDTMSSTTLTKSNAFGDAYTTSKNPYIGWCLNPNVNQNSSPIRSDDLCFPVVGGTQTTLEIATPQLLTLSDGSAPFQLMLKFDNVEITGKASLTSTVPIVSLGGDLQSNNSTTTVISGCPSSEIELPNQSSITMDATGAYCGATSTNFSTANFGNASVVMKNFNFNLPATTAGSLTIDGATVTATCARLTSCFTVTNSFSLLNATLNQGITSSAAEYSLEINAGSFNLGSTATINANARGYSYAGTTAFTGVTFPNATFYTGVTSGGSHGGKGGAASASGAPTYGSIFNPYTSGSSGVYDGGTSGNGGGIVRIELNGGPAVIDGVIDVGGGSGRSGGAGGSIFLNAGSVSGSGTLKAIGGNATAFGGGGGGRIAVNYTSASGGFAYPTSILARLQAWGGTYASTTQGHGAAGTIVLKSAAQNFGDLYVNNNNLSTASSNISTPINIPAPSTSSQVALTTGTLTDTGKFAELTSRMTNHLLGFCLNPNTAQNSTTTYADDTCFRISGQTVDTLTASGLNFGTAGNSYQVMLVLDNFEVTGKSAFTTSGPVLVNKGDISSNNDTSLIVVGQLQTTQSTFRIETPNLSVMSYDVSGATMTLGSISTSAALTLKNGTFNTNSITAGGLTLDNSTMTSTCLRGGACLELGGELTLINGSTLRQQSTTSASEYALEISATGLNIDGSSSISAMGRGYSYTGSSTHYARTFPNVEINYGDRVGGSHGGEGGSYSENGINSYGSFADPNTSGSSSTYWSGSSGSGGGVVRINLGSGTATINGTIEVSGAGAAGGGAGGSLLLRTGTLQGGGTLKANGGSTWDGRGGGGGRIAVYYTTALDGFAFPTNILARLQAFGGYGNYSNGAAGTIYLKSASQTYGDMIINNNSQITISGVYTPIKAVSGVSTSLSSTTLTQLNQFPESGQNTRHLLGMCLNPNTAQNSTTTYADDTCFPITAQTSDALSALNISSGASGNAYVTMFVLDNLEIRGRGNLFAQGPVLVKNGDIASGDTTSASTVGGVQASTDNTVEYQGLTSLTLDAGGSSQTLRPISITGNLTLSNGSFIMTCVKGSSNCVSVGGALTLQNGAILQHQSTTPTSEYALEISAMSLSIDGSSSISATGRGYSYTGASTHYARTFPNVEMNYGDRVGGSHGGEGGSYSDNGINSYGSFADPNTSGSSSTYWSGSSGSGGGVVRINLGSGTATINGTIEVSGAGAAGGGAGGSLLLRTGTLQGGGTLKANGGSTWDGRGGGGGRIAVYYTTALDGFAFSTNILARLQAFGGYGNYGHGAAGTIYLKSASQTFGDMIINNNSQITNSGVYTPIKAVSGVSTALSSTTLTQVSQFPESGQNTRHLLGMCLNPNTAQNSTATYSDDTCFPITEQTVDTLSAANISLGSAGNAYVTMLVLDNLEIRGRGNLFSQGPVLVKNGDIASGNATSASTVGGVQASSDNTIEYQGLTSLTLDAGGGSQTLRPISVAGDLTLSNGNFIMNCVKGSSNCVSVGGTLTLQNAANLQHQSTTPTTEYALEISAAGLNIDGASSISATGRGYSYTGTSSQYARTFPNVDVNYNDRVGGSHGGEGGSYSDNGINSYGSFADPNTSGSSGVYWNGSAPSGGGVVRINLGNGTATINGTIEANGVGYSGGGAGGSLLLRTGTLQGGGTLKANGGSTWDGRGGGGGRIAVYYTTALEGFAFPTNILSRLQAFGGYGNYGNGAAGTIYLKSASQTYGDMIINNNNQSTSSWVYTPLKSVSGTSTALSSSTLTQVNQFHESGQNTRHLLGMCLNPNMAQNSTTTYKDDTCFPIVEQTTDALSATSISSGTAGNSYVTMLVLNNLEVRGKGLFYPMGPVLVKNGDIASGTDDTFAMSGVISGTLGGLTEFEGLSSATFDSTGLSSSLVSSFNVLAASGHVVMSNGSFAAKFLDVAGNLSLNTANYFASSSGLSQNMRVGGDLNLNNISVVSSLNTTATEEYRLNIAATNISISGTSSVDVTGRGYQINTAGKIRTLGNTDYSTGGAGGSYGGGGAQSGATNPTYGSFKLPVDLGSSGAWNYSTSSSGGGAVRITATGTVSVDGFIAADGGWTSGWTSASGSGGSVLITTGVLTGTGRISADGGAGGAHVGGGGGRIAVYYDSSSGAFTASNVVNAIYARGADGTAKGGAGTVYLKKNTQTYGDLIINNGSRTPAANDGWTFLPTPSSTFSTDISADTLSALFTNSYSQTNQLFGFYVNPNTNQNATSKLSDDTLFPIVSNGLGSLTCSTGDLRSVAATGNPFKLVLVLDNLEVRGGGKLDFGTQNIYVMEGDLSSNNTTTFAQNGLINAGVVDVGAGTNWTNWTSSSTIGTKCSSNYSCP